MTEKTSIEKRLAAYAAFATAAGVSVLASAVPADSEVVFTPSNTQVSCNTPFSIDMNNDGITDFKIVSYRGAQTFSMALTGPGNAIMGLSSFGRSAYALLPHAPIVPTRNFHPSFALLAGGDVSGPVGYFGGTRNRAAGVRFKISGQNHYGWIGFRQFLIDGCDYTIAGWAYETIPNRPLRAGQTGGMSDNVTLSPQNFEDSGNPIPAIPAVLSLGAEGLNLWRKQGN